MTVKNQLKKTGKCTVFSRRQRHRTQNPLRFRPVLGFNAGWNEDAEKTNRIFLKLVHTDGIHVSVQFKSNVEVWFGFKDGLFKTTPPFSRRRLQPAAVNRSADKTVEPGVEGGSVPIHPPDRQSVLCRFTENRLNNRETPPAVFYPVCRSYTTDVNVKR